MWVTQQARQIAWTLVERKKPLQFLIRDRDCQFTSWSVAIVGAGPIGLAAVLTAQLYSPSAILMIDLDDHRLAEPKMLSLVCWR